MAYRYTQADDDCLELLARVRKDFFPGLKNARFLVLMDDRSVVRQGRAEFARVTKASDVIRCLTGHLADEGADYVLFLDQQVWLTIGNRDRIRLLRHELQHCFHDPDAKGNPCKLIGHDVEDFVQELERNADDPQWWDRLTQAWKKAYPKAKGDGPATLTSNQLELFEAEKQTDTGRSGKVVPLRQAGNGEAG